MTWDEKKHKSTTFREQLLQGVSRGMINDYELAERNPGPLLDHDAVVAMCTVNPIPYAVFWIIWNGQNLPRPPLHMWNRVAIFEGAGVVDEWWPGNNERGLLVEWYGSLKNLSKNILKMGWILRTSCPPPPPPHPPHKLIVHHGTYRDRG